MDFYRVFAMLEHLACYTFSKLQPSLTGYTKRRMPPHTSAYQRKDGVDDIGTIYFIVYRIYYILRSVYAKFCDKIIIITS